MNDIAVTHSLLFTIKSHGPIFGATMKKATKGTEKQLSDGVKC